MLSPRAAVEVTQPGNPARIRVPPRRRRPRSAHGPWLPTDLTVTRRKYRSRHSPPVAQVEAGQRNTGTSRSRKTVALKVAWAIIPAARRPVR